MSRPSSPALPSLILLSVVLSLGGCFADPPADDEGGGSEGATGGETLFGETSETGQPPIGSESATSSGGEGPCTPDCSDKSCGGDGCGDLCGLCSIGQACTAAGECSDNCSANSFMDCICDSGELGTQQCNEEGSGFIGTCVCVDVETGETGETEETGETGETEETGETGSDPPSGNMALEVSNNLPISTQCGEWNPSSIVMRNSGTTTWTADEDYKLGAVGETDPLYPNGNRILLPVGVAVPPNTDYEFEFAILAPEEPGFYFSDWQMIQEGVDWFGAISSRNVEVYCPEEDVNDAIEINNNLPSATPCGLPNNSSIVMQNSGTSTWTPEAGYKLGAVGDEDPLYPGNRILLPPGTSIPPGGEWEFEFDILAPDEPGFYFSEWQMLLEDVEWFGEISSRNVEVQCAGSGGETGSGETGDETGDETGGTCNQPPDCSPPDKDNVLQSAIKVKNEHPEYFGIEDLDDFTKRLLAYEMMTIVLNDLRSKGVNASRCVANPGLPESDPFLWCSDALVVGSPGFGTTIDIYQSWSDPAIPQVLITEDGCQTGVVTADLIPLP